MQVTRHLGREAPQGTKGSERALWAGGASWSALLAFV